MFPMFESSAIVPFSSVIFLRSYWMTKVGQKEVRDHVWTTHAYQAERLFRF